MADPTVLAKDRLPSAQAFVAQALLPAQLSGHRQLAWGAAGGTGDTLSFLPRQTLARSLSSASVSHTQNKDERNYTSVSGCCCRLKEKEGDVSRRVKEGS